MLRYVLRRHFEYITIKTPILSLVLAFITFAIVLQIAENAVVYEYVYIDARLEASEDNKIIYAADVASDFEYDTGYGIAFVKPINRDQNVSLRLKSDDVEDGQRRIHFVYDSTEPTDIEFPGEARLEVVADRKTLTERILGNFRR